MNMYTVIAYIVPEGGHHVEVVEANDATQAAVAVRDRLEFSREEFEVIAVAAGSVRFELIDSATLALAPYSVTSP